ncbi:MAG: discoidin domain-containing protein [Spirochaetales bacterium]|nr:discoidin domain-containing protein [Spirochaetales bacterium]
MKYIKPTGVLVCAFISLFIIAACVSVQPAPKALDVEITDADEDKADNTSTIEIVPSGNFDVEVWVSSEKNPGSGVWYKEPQEIAYKLAKQKNLRFTMPGGMELTTINVDSKTTYQKMQGLGYSFEESTVYNLMKMSPEKREEVLRALVDPEKGIGINLMRICLGTADFTARKFYSYDDMPEGETDVELKHFSIQKDIEYNIIKVLKEALSINPDLKFIASPWSPPGWMKTTDSLIRGYLKEEYTYVAAAYYRMAIQAYQEQGIPIYAMTIQNEPQYAGNYPGCLMDSDQMAELAIGIKKEFIAHGIKTKIFILDHNFNMALGYAGAILDDPVAYKAVAGTGFHDYGGTPSQMTPLHEEFPEKDIFFTERAVWGVGGMERIAEYIRNWSCTYNGWVTMLDSKIKTHHWPGTPGPTFLIQDADNPDNYWMTPEYYLLGQYTKFTTFGSRRIESGAGEMKTVTSVAFLNPDSTIALVVMNQSNITKYFNIMYNGNQATASIPANSVATYKWDAGIPASTAPYVMMELPNLAKGKKVKAFSESKTNPGKLAVDGKAATSWQSVKGKKQSISIDLGEETFYNVKKIILKWSSNYAKEYSIEFSVDGEEWKPVTDIKNGNGATDDLNVSVDARYIRINNINKGPQNTYGLNEVEVYGFESSYVPQMAFKGKGSNIVPGKIEAEDYDQGGDQVAYSDSDYNNNGGQYRKDGVDMESCAEGGFNVGWTAENEWLEYTLTVTKDGVYDITIRAAGMNSGKCHLEIDEENVSGSVGLAATGGWQSWQDVVVPGISLKKGTHIFRFACDSGGFNLNHFLFALSEGN